MVAAIHEGAIVKNVKILGRVSKEAPDVLFWTGSRYEMNVRAANLTVHIEAAYGMQEQWIAVVINGALLCRMPLLRGDNEVIIFRNRNAEETKNVRILKEVQPMPGDGEGYIRLTKVETDGTLEPVAEPKCRIQFIGDSITSGEGGIGANAEMDWVAQLFSGYDNYAYKTAEALSADYQVVSQSGWGVYCGYNNDIHSNVPGIYDAVCSLVSVDGKGVFGSLEPYDFEAFQPDVVVINLGTNDSGACNAEAYTDPETGRTYKLAKGEDGSLDAASAAAFDGAVRGFLAKLRSCHPQAYLLWVYGMLGTDMEEPILAAIRAYREESRDDRVDYLRLPDTKPGMFGSRWHPGHPAHESAAEVLTARIREILPGLAE